MECTELARQRIVLAVERTFSAWLRTGLALTAVALIMPKLLDLGRWMWVMRIIGIVLTITATIINYAAYRQYRIGSEKLSRQGISATPLWAITIMIAALMLCTLLSIVLLFEEL